MSAQYKPKPDEIKRLVNILDTASALMAAQVREEDIVIFLGTTKAGKSSLINFLLGNELVGEQDEMYLPVSIRKVNNLYGPAIGASATSETIIPTRWENLQKLPGLALWDAPGFDDNRGPIQDIANAYYIYELFKNIRSIRIALVVEIDDIAKDRINTFLALLNSVENLLQSRMRDCYSSIVVVFSKVPNTFSMASIRKLLEHKILKNSSIDISPTGKDFIKYLLRDDHQQQIGLFMMANIGKIDDNIDRGVTTAILGAVSVKSEILKEVVCPSLADKSQNFLFRARGSLSSMKSFKDLIDIVKNVFNQRLKKYMEFQEDVVNNDKLHAVKAELIVILNEIDKIFDSNISFQRKITLLQMIDPEIENKINKDNLIEKSKLIQFVDRLLKMQEQQEFDLCVEQILKHAQSEVEKLKISVEMKLGEISRSEYDKKIENLQAKHEEEMNNLKSQLDEVQKHNKDVASQLGLFGTIGDKVDKVIEGTRKKFEEGVDYVVSFFKS